MNYEDVIQEVDAQLSSSQRVEASDTPPSAKSASDSNILNMIALEINRKGGY